MMMMIHEQDDVQPRTSRAYFPARPHRTRVRRGGVTPMILNSSKIAKLLAISLLCSCLLGARSLPVPTHADRPDAPLAPFDNLQPETEDSSNDRLQEDHTFPGDIILHETKAQDHSKRGLTARQYHRWDNATIPFTFHSMFPVSARKKVLRAISHWHKKTCIQFIPHSIEPFFIRFTMAEACTSEVGLQKYLKHRGQDVFLTPSCTENRGNIIHELGHAIGLYHEVTRPDRDQYIEIIPENIRQGMDKWFGIQSSVEIDSLGVAYDLGSIMHFSPKDFAKPGKVAFRVRDNVTFDGIIGQRESVSEKDIRQVDLFYNCENEVGSGEIESLDVIRSGNAIALKALGTNQNLWVGCNGESCSMDGCPGKKFKPEKKATCGSNEFYFHNVDGSKKLLVGNRVILRTRMNMSSGEGEMVICENGECFSSDICETDAALNTPSCQDHVFVINVPGKNIGDALHHKDEIILSFEVINDYKIWVVCDLDGSTCTKPKGCRDRNVGDPPGAVADAGGSGDDNICVTPEQKYEVHKLL